MGKSCRQQLIKLDFNQTYTKQLRSARSSMKSNSWLMSYVMDGLLGFILFRCSSYILHTPVHKAKALNHLNNNIFYFMEIIFAEPVVRHIVLPEYTESFFVKY